MAAVAAGYLLLIVLWCERHVEAVPLGHFMARSRTTRETHQGPPCIGCRHQSQNQGLSEEDMRQLQIELIKIKILKGLNMQAPPNVNSSRPIPAPLIQSMYGRLGYQSDHPERPSNSRQRQPHADHNINKVSVMAEIGEVKNDALLARSKTFQFRFKKELYGYSVAQATLWIHTTLSSPASRNSTSRMLFVSETHGKQRHVTEVGGVPGRIVAKGSVSLLQGWKQFDVTHTVQNWLKHGHHVRSLSITCLGGHSGARVQVAPVSESGELTPFLIINMDKKNHVRGRRSASTECRQSGGCCIKHLYVDFAAIGWTWMRVPSGYTANYCLGSCSFSNGLSTYGDMLVQYLRNTPTASSSVTPCCGAVQMAPISIMYEVEGGQHLQRTLPNMRVISCECR